jgi:dihydrofolate synthase/folylpolyglutamate synthase
MNPINPRNPIDSAYQETLDFLFHLETSKGIDLKLERVRLALAALGSPERDFVSLHIAGTNGKGSTAAILHAILSAAGYRTALYTSPHLVDFCERIRIGGHSIVPQEVVELVNELCHCFANNGLALTYFEFVTVLAFYYFARSQVEVAAVEVGLGGRFDATNVVAPGVAVITSVGLDHEEYLGTNLASIAREKGGIIKGGVPAVVGKVDKEIEVLLREIADSQGSPVYLFAKDFLVRSREDATFDYHGLGWRAERLPLSLRGAYQRRNAAVALAALELIHSQFPVGERHIREGLEAVRWPGRLQIVQEKPLVVLDGAHNPQGVETLVEELPTLLGSRRVKLLFGVMQDKKWTEMVPPLARIASEVVVTRAARPRGEDPHALARAFAPFLPTRVVEDAQEACWQLIQETDPQGAVLVCGSLFLIGAVYPFFCRTKNGFSPLPARSTQVW